MKDQINGHLRDEQIIWAVIDRQELPGEARQHLQACVACNTKVAQFSDDLQKFGRDARQAVPPFSSTVILPVAKSSKGSHYGGWLPFFGAAAMAGLLMFFYFMGMQTVTPIQYTMLQQQENLLEDEALMREISEMVEYPLSEDIYRITGENGAGYDDEFFDFIVPGMQDDSQSELFI